MCCLIYWPACPTCTTITRMLQCYFPFVNYSMIVVVVTSKWNKKEIKHSGTCNLTLNGLHGLLLQIIYSVLKQINYNHIVHICTLYKNQYLLIWLKQKLIRGLKRASTIHFFGSMLQNIQFCAS